jgi:hypothetical protein
MDTELKQYLDANFGRMDKRFAAMDERFAAMDERFDAIDEKFVEMEDRLVEKMRDMQTELLRGFAAFTEAQTIRLRKVEADQSNLDAALSGRVAVLEKRLLEIELRLGGALGRTGPS